jgi:hypothetical protein
LALQKDGPGSAGAHYDSVNSPKSASLSQLEIPNSTPFFIARTVGEFSCFSGANLPLHPRCAGDVPTYTAPAK